MFIPGLCAISFRKNRIDEIARAARDCGLPIIEWGADVSVPPATPERVLLASTLREECALSYPTYGSYFRIGLSPSSELLPLFDTAIALGSRTVRVWGYNKLVSPENEELWAMLVKEAQIIADYARERGLSVALECHNNTVTAHYENSLRFLDCVERDNLRMYWQPNHLLSYDYNIASARALAPYVDVIHAFNWDKAGRYPLADGKDVWLGYLGEFSQEASLRDVPVLLEFMPDGDISSLPCEAAALREILDFANKRIATQTPV